MKYQAVVWLLLISTSTLAWGQECTPYLKYPDHTMCIYKAKACQPGLQLLRSDGFTSQQKSEIVRMHNDLRRNIVTGTISKAPAAVQMSYMTWDNELETIAQRAADQCKFVHDKERRVSRFYVGQNMYMGMQYPVDKNAIPNISEAIMSWFNEVYSPGFPAAYIKPFKFEFGAGHYTQIAWADTKNIGCGYTMFVEGGWSKTIIVCNYGPGGNIIGGTMYEVRN